MIKRFRYMALLLAYGMAAASVTCTGERTNENTSAVSSQALATDSVYQLMLPNGVLPRQVALGATQELRVSNGVSADALLVSTGSLTTDIGADATIGSLQSVPNVVLQARSVAHGDVTTEGTVTLSSGSKVEGLLTEGTNLGPQQVHKLTVSFEAAVADVSTRTRRSSRSSIPS